MEFVLPHQRRCNSTDRRGNPNGGRVGQPMAGGNRFAPHGRGRQYAPLFQPLPPHRTSHRGGGLRDTLQERQPIKQQAT